MPKVFLLQYLTWKVVLHIEPGNHWHYVFGLVHGLWDSSLVAWLTQSLRIPDSSPAAADIFPWCTHMQWPKTVQIHENSWQPKRMPIVFHLQYHTWKVVLHIEPGNHWHYVFGLVHGLWDSSLVAWLTQSLRIPDSSPAAADIFPWCTHMQWPKTVQIHENSWQPKRITDSRRIQKINKYKYDQYVNVGM